MIDKSRRTHHTARFVATRFGFGVCALTVCALLGLGCRKQQVPKPSPVASAKVRDIGVGDGFRCALLDDGAVSCWGQNDEGQLGDGGGEPKTSPTRVPGLDDVTSIAVGASHVCAVRRDQSLWCWGKNHLAQINAGRQQVRWATRVSGVDGVAQVVAGRDHTCVRLTGTFEGQVRCFGGNEFGQVGSKTDSFEPSPTRVNLRSPATLLASGSEFTCALTTEKQVWCWGRNSDGQLGDGTRMSGPTPRSIKTYHVVWHIAILGDYACALLPTEQVACWGKNEHGQLGDGSKILRDTPVLVAGIDGASGLEVGNRYACAWLRDGRERCWGEATGEQSTRLTDVHRKPCLLLGDGGITCG